VSKFKIKKYRFVYCSVLSIVVLLIVGFGVKTYLEYVERRSAEILELTEDSFETSNITLQRNGLYIVDLKKDLDEYEKNRLNNTITYEIKGEEIYFDINILKNEETGENVYEIRKIGDDRHNVKAKMNLKNIEQIEFRTGYINDATVLKLNTTYDSLYFAMIDNAYYFLGEDIESISFIDDHFYYVSYNKNYKSLMSANECTSEVKKSIYGFNEAHTFYTYGKINFFEDFYQKLSSKSYSVKNYCDDLLK